MNVIKRTGKIVPFDKERIVRAINKAVEEVYPNDKELPNYGIVIADQVEEVAQQYENNLTVEEIQDLVEDYLTDYDRLVAKAYIKYRYKRGVMRACSTEFIRAISEKLRATNVQNQNANIDDTHLAAVLVKRQMK